MSQHNVPRKVATDALEASKIPPPVGMTQNAAMSLTPSLVPPVPSGETPPPVGEVPPPDAVPPEPAGPPPVLAQPTRYRVLATRQVSLGGQMVRLLEGRLLSAEFYAVHRLALEDQNVRLEAVEPSA